MASRICSICGCYRRVVTEGYRCVKKLTRQLDQLDQYAPGVPGVDEVDPRAGRTAPGRLVPQPHAPGPQRRRGRLDVGHLVRHLLQSRSPAIQERGDG